MTEEMMTVALPKGKLLGPTVKLLGLLGLPAEGISEESRKLIYEYPEMGVQYVMCRPTDVPTFVEHGAADLGIVGKDIILDQEKDVFEMLDLGYGYCRFVLAVPADQVEVPLASLNYKRVATKFPAVARQFFSEKGLQVEVIKLHGNIELAPRVGLAEMIIDIVSTGKTLKENNLAPREEIAVCTARLIVNRVSYRTKNSRINPLIEKMKVILQEGTLTDD
ncbi:MAG: ATP phosphoribosyltransferase [Solirubrobacterales bacterium]